MNRKVLFGGCAAIFLSIAVFLLQGGAGQKPVEETADYGGFRAGVTYAMNTVVEQKWYGENADSVYAGVEALIRELEGGLSMHLPKSEIMAINQNAGVQPVQVSQRTFDLLYRAKELSNQSGGSFDITIAPLVELWGITSDHPRVPGEEELAAALALVGVEELELDTEGRTAYLPRQGMAIDLGGIAKGWACDQIRDYALAQGVERGYVSLGGNLMVIGKKPDGSDFLFGLRDPQGDASEYIGTLTLEGLTMATTGGYERYFEQDGVRYHHVLDPQTGRPAESDLLSVTVISPDGTLADYLSTVLFIQGREAAIAVANEEAFSLVIVDREGNVYLSPALKGVFTPNEEKTAYHFIYL